MDLCAHGVPDRPCLGRVFMKEAWKEVDCSEGKVEVGLAWRLNCFSLTHKTVGSHCVFKGSMI